MKRQSTKWEKNLKMKQLKWINIKYLNSSCKQYQKTKNPIKMWTDLNRHVSKKKIHTNGKKHMKEV